MSSEQYNGEYHIALLFTNIFYIDNSLELILFLINQKFPNTKLNIHNFVINNNLTNVNESLDEFTNLYPTSNRVIISCKTSILNATVNYLKLNNLDILSLSVNSTALTTKKLYNVITYGYYLSTLISSYFCIIEDYGFTNIIIMNDVTNVNSVFYNNYKETIYTQNNLLKKINIIEYYLNENRSYEIPNNSLIFILCENDNLINKYKNNINFSLNNKSSIMIGCSDSNNGLPDIFGDIPAVVPFLIPSMYTKTTNLIYKYYLSNNKIINSNSIYAFYDILYTLNYCSENKIFINKTNYTNVNPFINDSPSLTNGYKINATINGYSYSNYDFVFTKDSILQNDRSLYDTTNINSITSTLPNSKSLFRTIGIYPTLPTPLVYLDRNYIKIYKNNLLQYVKFDYNVCNIDDKIINISNKSICKFIINFDRNTYLFTYLDKIFDNKKLNYPAINSTMSKIIEFLYIK